jgi:hypothetical protein
MSGLLNIITHTDPFPSKMPIPRYGIDNVRDRQLAIYHRFLPYNNNDEP